MAWNAHSNSDLSALDVKLSQLYQQVMSKSNDVDSLKKSQNEWRKTKRDACSDVNCLASTYNERINELSQMLSSSNAPTQLPSNSTDAIQKQAIQQQKAPQPQSIQPEANPNQLVADETAKEVLKAEISADLARIAANEKAEAAKAPIATEQNNTSQVTTPIFLSTIVGWFVNHILVVCALLAILAFMMIKHSIKVVEAKSGIVFVDGTDGIITFGLAFIPIVFAAIAMYITDTEFTGTKFGNYYLLFLGILGVIISIRTIAQNFHNPITLVSVLFTKLLIVTLFVFALIVAIVILMAGARNRKQGDNESNAEYRERQQDERIREVEYKIAAGATAAGAFFGAANAIDKLTTFKSEYSFSLTSLVRWFSETIMTKERIFNSRSDSVDSESQADSRDNKEPKNNDSNKVDHISTSWFRILGVLEGATKEEIVAAYKQMMRQYHPDKVSQMGKDIRDVAEFKSKQINAAYDYAMNLQ